jgi:rhodanese-related sulfurtransferase
MRDQHAFRTVMPDELAKVWPRATLVDVRSREEHATAHVPGSMNIPLDELSSRHADPPHGTIYLVCGSG